MKHSITTQDTTLHFATTDEYVKHQATDCIAGGLDYEMYAGYMQQWATDGNDFTLSCDEYEELQRVLLDAVIDAFHASNNEPTLAWGDDDKFNINCEV